MREAGWNHLLPLLSPEIRVLCTQESTIANDCHCCPTIIVNIKPIESSKNRALGRQPTRTFLSFSPVVSYRLRWHRFYLLMAPYQSSSHLQWQLRREDHVVTRSWPRSRRKLCLGRWQARVLWRRVDGIRHRPGYGVLAYLADFDRFKAHSTYSKCPGAPRTAASNLG